MLSMAVLFIVFLFENLLCVQLNEQLKHEAASRNVMEIV